MKIYPAPHRLANVLFFESRYFRLALAVVFLTMTFADASVDAKEGGNPQRPNVLFIAIDDLNDWVGFLNGNPNVQTPNMDRLAARSVVFTNAQCPAPACVPSRNAMFTSLHPTTTGMYTNGCGNFRKAEITKEAVTLPQHFMQNGYRAEGVGKITHSTDTASWHEFGKVTAEKHLPNHEGYWQHWGMLDVEKEEMVDWKRAQWTVGRIKKGLPEPFFLACGFHLPHVDWHAPKAYLEKFPVDEIELPPINLDDYDDIPGRENSGELFKKRYLDTGKAKQAVQGYLGCIHFVDECVGQLVDALDDSQFKDNTIIVLWSDHGMHVGEKLRYGKFALWEESAHAPLLFSAPSLGIEPGRCDEVANLIDIYPTLIDLCGLPKRDGLDGISLMPQLQDPTTERASPSMTSNRQYQNTLRTKRWRYIRSQDGSDELYDHDHDPNEWRNLADNPEYASVIKELSAFIPIEQAMDLANSPENVARREASQKKQREKKQTVKKGKSK
ncbi:Choline-sulfatase [Planctomycetes bacterium CA13]|uniref:Choline-sulfatase n=1 Tax=Novipirellula herctigrandis TaxID=2527986 RepID=A0A5C5ZB20_9BACT|nr:Choline-sulfatase [Planctomycetes bacterium CA13]